MIKKTCLTTLKSSLYTITLMIMAITTLKSGRENKKRLNVQSLM
jgi:hypothetical protein